MFKTGVSIVGEEIFPGVIRRVLLSSEDVTMLEIHIAQGALAPTHSHPEHATVGYVVSGQVEVVQGGERHVLAAGDSFFTPKGVEHSIKALLPVKLIEIFSPPRSDLA